MKKGITFVSNNTNICMGIVKETTGFHIENKNDIYNCIHYPDHSISVRLYDKVKPYAKSAEIIVIDWVFTGSDSIIELCQLVDALRSINNTCKYTLVLPLFPGSREDRRNSLGDSLSLKVYANIINSLNFNTVVIADPHSDVTKYAVKNYVNYNDFFKSDYFVAVILDKLASMKSKKLQIISPDSGSIKKIRSIVQDVYSKLKTNAAIRIIRCDKNRDVTTGEITGFSVLDNFNPRIESILIDDIIDGGGTFLGLFEELQKVKPQIYPKVHLRATHGIFSKGRKDLEGLFMSVKTQFSYDN